MAKFLKNNIFFISAAVVCAGIALTLFILFPYSGDDWYWASHAFSWTTITELNGRYLGSVLSLIITKYRPLRVIICLIITFALVFVLSSSVNARGKRGLYFAVSAALIAIMPVIIISETFVWASGFANYVPSALIALIYTVMVKGEFSGEAPQYCKAMPFWAALIGFVGAFFLETVTIGNVIVGAAVLIYHLIRFKKPNATLIAFLGGAIIGAILMLVNPVYFGIAGGNDQVYGRTINFSAIIDTYFNKGFYSHFAYDNFLLNLFIVGMFLWLFIRRFPFMHMAKRVISICCFVLQLAFLALSGASFLGIALPAFKYIGAIKGLLTAAFFAALIAQSVCISKDVNFMLRLLFLLGAILAYTLPLLVVNPIGGRNFLVSYLLFASFAIILLEENIGGAEKGEKALFAAFFAVAMAAMVGLGAFYIYRYSIIRTAYNEREYSVIAQLKDGSSNVTIQTQPVEDEKGVEMVEYVHNADPDNPYLAGIFKAYYGIPDAVELIIITPQ